MKLIIILFLLLVGCSGESAIYFVDLVPDDPWQITRVDDWQWIMDTCKQERGISDDYYNPSRHFAAIYDGINLLPDAKTANDGTIVEGWFECACYIPPTECIVFEIYNL